MNFIEEKLQKALASVNAKLAEQGQADFVPEVAAILGSGLGDFADECVKTVATVSYNDIEGFPVSTISGHKGQFVFGYVGETKVVIMQGRVHYYEGYPMTDVVMPTRLMNLMGAKKLLLTNAAGGCNKSYAPGDLMIINDHITSFAPSCLIGPNYNPKNVKAEYEEAPRFPDMSEVYNKEMIAKIHELADKNGIKVQEGVYLQTTGPAYEAPVEVRAYAAFGADAIGMSTACEAVAANHIGMKIAGISCITNMCTGMSDQPLSHEEVKETADRVAVQFKKLVEEVIVNF